MNLKAVECVCLSRESFDLNCLAYGAPGRADLVEGELTSEAGHHYQIRQGIPVFVPSAMLTEIEQETQAEYDASADQKYDAAVDGYSGASMNMRMTYGSE